MFSLDKFYHVLHDNLISQFRNARSYHFFPFGTYDTFKIVYDPSNSDMHTEQVSFYAGRGQKVFFHCFFYDQEPLFSTSLPHDHVIMDLDLLEQNYARKIHIFANSEKSAIKTEIVKKNFFYDWYYFFHGFAALDWYRDFEYLRPESFNRFNKVFICYNHLISNYRSYRLHLVSNLVEHNLVEHGHVSFFLKDQFGTWQDAVNDTNSLLDPRAKDKITTWLPTVAKPLIIDTEDPYGALSADVDINQLTSALWHIVTETIYFHPKLHLTEKVFKPIVAQRPFMLVAAVGNLAYLKSYGFKTFDRWIDESYDTEEDHYVRIEKITAELKRLCAMSSNELKQMHEEMQEVLLYNYNHFYGDFKRIIVDELVDNFEGVLMQINNGRMPNNHSRHHQRFELCKDYYTEVKQRLLK